MKSMIIAIIMLMAILPARASVYRFKQRIFLTTVGQTDSVSVVAYRVFVLTFCIEDGYP